MLNTSIWSTWTNAKSIPTWQGLATQGAATEVPTAGEDQKFMVFGFVDYTTDQVLWQTSARKGETAFMAFLEYLVEALLANALAVLVLDNVGYHKRHALRRVWCRYANRLEPFFLPAYSP